MYRYLIPLLTIYLLLQVSLAQAEVAGNATLEIRLRFEQDGCKLNLPVIVSDDLGKTYSFTLDSGGQGVISLPNANYLIYLDTTTEPANCQIKPSPTEPAARFNPSPDHLEVIVNDFTPLPLVITRLGKLYRDDNPSGTPLPAATIDEAEAANTWHTMESTNIFSSPPATIIAPSVVVLLETTPKLVASNSFNAQPSADQTFSWLLLFLGILCSLGLISYSGWQLRKPQPPEHKESTVEPELED